MTTELLAEISIRSIPAGSIYMPIAAWENRVEVARRVQETFIDALDLDLQRDVLSFITDRIAERKDQHFAVVSAALVRTPWEGMA